MFLRSGTLFVFICLASGTAAAQVRPDPLAQSSRREREPPPQEQGLSGSFDPEPRSETEAADAGDSASTAGGLVSSVEGALQLSVSTAFVQYTSLSASYDAGGDADISNTNWGFAKNPILLEGGYGINERMLIGGVLQLGGVSSSAARGSVSPLDTSEFNFAIGPKFDFHFMPDSRFNPFVGALVTIGSNSTDAADLTEDSRLLFNLLLRGGARYFLFDQLSIDPQLTFGAVLGSGTTKSGMLKYDYSFSGFQFALAIGLSFWLK